MAFKKFKIAALLLTVGILFLGSLGQCQYYFLNFSSRMGADKDSPTLKLRISEFKPSYLVGSVSLGFTSREIVVGSHHLIGYSYKEGILFVDSATMGKRFSLFATLDGSKAALRLETVAARNYFQNKDTITVSDLTKSSPRFQQPPPFPPNEVTNRASSLDPDYKFGTDSPDWTNKMLELAMQKEQIRYKRITDRFYDYVRATKHLDALEILKISGGSPEDQKNLLQYILDIKGYDIERTRYATDGGDRFPLSNFAEIFFFASMISDTNLMLSTINQADPRLFQREMNGPPAKDADWSTYFLDTLALRYRQSYSKGDSAMKGYLAKGARDVLKIISENPTSPRMKIVSDLRKIGLDPLIAGEAQLVLKAVATSNTVASKEAKKLLNRSKWDPRMLLLNYCSAKLSTKPPEGIHNTLFDGNVTD